MMRLFGQPMLSDDPTLTHHEEDEIDYIVMPMHDTVLMNHFPAVTTPPLL